MSAHAPIVTGPAPEGGLPELAAGLEELIELAGGATQRHDGWTPDRRRAFLAALSQGHSVTHCA